MAMSMKHKAPIMLAIPNCHRVMTHANLRVTNLDFFVMTIGLNKAFSTKSLKVFLFVMITKNKVLPALQTTDNPSEYIIGSRETKVSEVINIIVFGYFRIP
jgi:hypothetical protein